VLGLPQSDAAARDLAFFWDLLAPGEDLHGGYLVAAWHDGVRPIAMILADDAAALYAARFELEAAPAPRGMTVLDFTKPPAETGLRFRNGRHTFRPRFGIRALYSRSPDEAAVLDAVAAHANRFWLPSRLGERALRFVPCLRRHGVEPVVVIDGGLRGPTEARLRPWVEKHGFRHVALLAPRSVGEARLSRTVAHLRETFDLDEIVVLHDTARVAEAYGTWPRFTKRPSLREQGRFTLDDVRRARASSPGPLLFVDTWSQASRTPVPSRPRGRPPGFERWFDGVIVWQGRHGTGDVAVLEDAWSRGEGDREEWEDVLLPLLPRSPLDPQTFLTQATERIEAADKASHHAVGWLRGLGRMARLDARRFAGRMSENTVLVPRVRAAIHADGRLDERAWGFAASLEIPLPGDPAGRTATLLAFADGKRLHMALRTPAESAGTWLQIRAATLHAGGAGIQLAGPGEDDRTRDSGVLRGGAWAWRLSPDTYTWEGTLDHYDLRGDAHPLRVFDLYTRLGEGVRRLGTLVLGP
jgi:hypothetical protein